MPNLELQEISLSDVEREIASSPYHISFSPRIEGAFEEASQTQRIRLFTVTVVSAAILYDLFLFADWATLTDMAWFMTIARLGIFTPAVAVALVLVRRRVSNATREGIAVLLGVLAILLPMVAMTFSESPYRLSYQYGSLLVMMSSAVVLRLRFAFASVSLGSMLAIQLVTTYWSGAFDAQTYLGIVLFFVTASVLLALTTYLLERSERRSFLFALRGELLRQRIESGARTDALTGLFNRRHLGEVQRELWSEADQKPRAIAAILLDIDHFKSFNDSRGHLEGDVCLRAVSACIAAVVRTRNGLAFRFGGEEMLVLMPDTEIADAVAVAEAIRTAIEAAAIPHPATRGVVTASLGVAGAIAPETTAHALVSAADTALYAAKRDGRNRVRLLSDLHGSMNAAA